MELYQINQFLAFARIGNISKAAEEANTSQPALSRAMKHLEEELDVPLFVRTKNTIALNEYGKLAVRYAQRIQDDVSDFYNAVREQYRREHTITIASCAPAPLWFLPRLLQQCNPDIAVTTELRDITELKSDLDKKDAQIAVFTGEVSDEKYFCKKWKSEALCLSVPKGHRLEKRKSVSFSDFDGETMLLMNEIGFWHEINKRYLPNCRFLVQNERTDFSTLVNTSSLPSFTTNLAKKNNDFKSDRTDIPITDKEAKADFYVVCLKSEYGKLREFFELVGRDSED